MDRARSRSPRGGNASGVDQQAQVVIQALVDKRQFCRRTRDFEEADRIRDQLKHMQVVVSDGELAWKGPGGTSGSVDNGGLPPPGNKGKEGEKGTSKGGVRERRDGDWDCPGCGKVVWASKEECFSCGTHKFAAAAAYAGAAQQQIGAAVTVVEEIETTEQFNMMAAQVKDEMARLPSTFLAGLVAAAARVVHFDPELVVDLLPTLAKKLKLQVNGIASDAFALEDLISTLSAMIQLGSHEFVIFDYVATILMDEMDAMNSEQRKTLMEAYNATSDGRHQAFVNLLTQKEEQADEESRKLQEQREHMKKVLDTRMKVLKLKVEVQKQGLSVPSLQQRLAMPSMQRGVGVPGLMQGLDSAILAERQDSW